MSMKLWISTLTVASLVGISLISSITRGESRDMNNNDSNAQSSSGSVEQTNVGQSQQEILDYWTPERMRNAKPIMPTVPGNPNSRDYRTPDKPNKPAVAPSAGDARPPQQGQNVNPPMTSGSGTPNAGDYWTPDRMRNAKPIMPTVPGTPSAGESSEGSGSVE